MEREFIATLSSNRILGSVILPYAVNRKNGQKFLTIKDRVTLDDLNRSKEIPGYVADLVKAADKYDENEIVKIFSRKKKSRSDFFNSLTDKTIENEIRPYVEARLVKALDIIKENSIPFFFKDQQHNIHFEDQIEIVNTTAETVFHFIKEDEGSKYFLSVQNGGQDLVLTNKKGFVLVNNPCRLIIENKLFSFDGIDGKKILPFFSKEFISIPKSSEKKYFETFVRNSIRDYIVKSSGFQVVHINNLPQSILSLENDLDGFPTMILKFQYEKNSVYYYKKSSSPKVLMTEEDSSYKFEKITRNEDYENEIASIILEKHLRNSGSSQFNLQKPDADINDYIEWIAENKNEFSKKGIRFDQSYYQNIYCTERIELDIKVSYDNDWFDVYGLVRIGSYEFPFVKLRKNILKNIRHYELPDGKIAVLPEEWFEKYRDMFLFAQKSDKNLKLKNYHARMVQQDIGLPKNVYGTKIENLNFHDSKHDLQVPPGLNAEMRPYQIAGYHYMIQIGKQHLGACLADDMGLGKTLQTLSVLQYKIENGENIIEKVVPVNQPKQLSLFNNEEVTRIKERQASLIVMPASLIHNWHNEIAKFTPNMKVCIYTGINRNKDISTFGEYDLILTTYGTLRVDIAILEKYDFFYIILDESQVIKNVNSKTYKAVNQLNSHFRLVLTGTPIENSLGDLWAQMNFLNPGLLGTYSFFRDEFLSPIEKLRDEHKQIKLKYLIQPFILRRTKHEVAKDLPDLWEQTIFCDLSEEQEKYYEKEKSKIRNAILQNIDSNGVEKSSFVVLQGLTKLRQLANHPILIDREYQHDSGKFEEVIRNIDNLAIENHKTLIFSSFVKHLELFETYLTDREYGYAKLTGETKNRENEVDKFQNDQECKFFLISIKAGGVGLNLTAAEYVFILDPWWNPAVENQAVSRAHRIGQNKNVFVYRFISGNTIEEKIQQLQDRKSKLADAFVNSNNPLKELSVDSVMELFK